MTELVIKVGGQAGQGANVVGRTLAKIFARSGLNVIGYPEYPSLVRGGHNVYQIRVSKNKIYSPVEKCNIIIALNKDAVFFHHKYLQEPGAIIYDSGVDVSNLNLDKKIMLYPLPIKEILEKGGGDAKMENIVMAGALLSLIGYPLDEFNNILEETFSRKGKEVVEVNQNCAKISYDYVKNNLKSENFPLKISKGTEKGKMIIGGNEAAGMGAIAGGLRFYAAYPMTPASGVLHYLAEVERKANIVVKHTEDEIAAINYAVGAAYAGVRAMTGSSGGGFALMTETIGMAALAETPLVIYLAQRTGPSTGMPTWTEQADLKFALNASQGDFLRVIFAPGSIEESFYLTAEAFNIADKYQLPVMVLTDKFLAESHFSCEEFDQSEIKIERGKIAKNLPKMESMERFKRYKITNDGVSERSFPGEPNGMHVATSYVHDETGYSTESFKIRNEMVKKLEKKLPYILKELPKPKIYGKENAEITVVVWGSQLLPALDALKMLENKGIAVNVLHFSVVFPIDEKEILGILSKCKRTVMVENNSTAQFAGILREYTGFVPDFYVLRFDGRQFFPENIVEKIIEIKNSDFKGEKKLVVSEKEDFEYYNTQKFGLM
ncbi:MAG: 2-oxoacid:acceptor oxidoreductase subunit alpha [Candidatus ainarchaeum sp.]|nr:2-oxoacid:acceptor oxidoreductase subunit alpha [Candidatus ainarchaeum sp.]